MVGKTYFTDTVSKGMAIALSLNGFVSLDYTYFLSYYFGYFHHLIPIKRAITFLKILTTDLITSIMCLYALFNDNIHCSNLSNTATTTNESSTWEITRHTAQTPQSNQPTH